MKKKNNPHNNLIGKIFSRKKEYTGLLKGYLPEDIQSIADINNVELAKDTFINEKLEEYRSDLIFNTHLAQEEGFLHVIFEHKSDPKKMAGLQLLRYIMEDWDLIIDGDPKIKKLPPIICLLLYHGKKTWKLSENFQDMIQFQEKTKEILAPYVPQFKFVVVKLTGENRDKIADFGGNFTGKGRSALDEIGQ